MADTIAASSRDGHHPTGRPWKVALALFLLAALAGNFRDTGRNARHFAWTPRSAAAAEYGDEETTFFQAAGPCARCHVVSVVEWGISGHYSAATHCQSCHGESAEHVANERNEIPPDHVVRGTAIARQLCARCHASGCPSTRRTQSCQDCHHVHALLDPTRPPAMDSEAREAQIAQIASYRQQMVEAEAYFSREMWTEAEASFRRALDSMPGDRRASARSAACQRRLHPALAGFEHVSGAFDQETGLPRDVVTRGLDLPMRLVPGGSYEMGSEAWPDAQPVHTVRLEAFFLGQTEVTQRLWRTVMGNNPSAHQGDAYPDADDMPVDRISWHDALAFIERLNQRVPGSGFRLPREAEWEYACRAGTVDFDPRAVLAQAWCTTSARPGATPDDPLKIEDLSPRPVARRRPNPWGFFDLQGNIAEWCADRWQPYVGAIVTPDDAPTLRVLRGGSYADPARAMDPALRHAAPSHRRLRFYGLRLVRDVPPPGSRGGD